MILAVPPKPKLRAASASDQLNWHPKQSAYYRSLARFNVVPAGRRSGKTAIAKRRLRRKALMHQGAEGVRYIASAPTQGQAKRIYWNDLKLMLPEEFRREKINNTDMVIPLISGADVQVLGLDVPARVEGSPIGHMLLDEYGNMKEGLWEENVYPALLDSQGTADLIGVPEGRNHYYRIFTRTIGNLDKDWRGHTWFTSEILPYYLGRALAAKEIANAQRNMDPLTYQQEFEASFLNFQGRAYYTFDRSTHAVDRIKYNKNQPLILCFDFNVSPGVCVYVQELRYRGVNPKVDELITGAIGEVWIPKGSNTKRVCNKVIADWGKRHKGIVYLYGDATGGAGGSAKLEGSDWDIIKNTLKPIFGDRLRDRVKRGNPAERARVNAVNTRCMRADGTIAFMVDPLACPRLIDDLDGVTVMEGTDGEIDKDTDKTLTHISDAFGYYAEAKYPVRSGASLTRTTVM